MTAAMISLAAQRMRVRWVTAASLLLVLHVVLTLMVVWWALILAAPWPTFPTSKSYSEFVRINPSELYWATGFGVAGLIGCCGCWAARPGHTGGRRKAALRVASGLVLGVNHGIIAWLTFRGNPASTGTGIYVLIMLTAYILAAAEAERLD